MQFAYSHTHYIQNVGIQKISYLSAHDSIAKLKNLFWWK